MQNPLEVNMIRKTIQTIVLFIAISLFAIPGFQAKGEGSLPVLVGIYPSAEVYQTVGEINALNTYLETPTVSIAGTFLDFESPNWLIIAELNAAWDNNYVPFINLGAGDAETQWTAQQIADGAIDAHIRRWAKTYKTLVGSGDERHAFIAPLQEANGAWVPYGRDPANFIRAYLRIRQIFNEEAVPVNSVSWVFAPNGWNDPANPQDTFENYYPGNSAVDAVGFSSFNFGDCWSYTNNEPYEEIYQPYLNRMAAMAPGKPIIIAEIGSVAYGLDRAAWFTDTLSKIGAFPGVRAILYFNRQEHPENTPGASPCNPIDYGLDSVADGQGGPAAEGKQAFKAQVTQAPYGYWAPNSTEMANIGFGRPSATFEDVWPASNFAGKNTTPYYQPWVERLVSAGITGGCRNNLIDFEGVTDFSYRYYCPNNTVTRAQMAIFLEKGMNSSAFTPPAATGTRFNDVPASYWAAAWIEQLAADGITGGCGAGNYCPDSPVTRAQMAVFLLKSKYGSSYSPPAVGESTGFGDVATNYWAAAWIKQLAAEGITGGCGAGIYCPDNPVTRAQMAIFLVRTFNLP